MHFEDVSTLLEIANRSAQKIDLMIHGNVQPFIQYHTILN
jgi:hypothetical protein